MQSLRHSFATHLLEAGAHLHTIQKLLGHKQITSRLPGGSTCIACSKDWEVDPEVWRKDWGVHIQPAGSGASALKYLGAYVSRTAITNARMLRVNEDSVTFRWKDRSERNGGRELTLSGVEFARRYLRHVLPAGLRSVRY